MSAAPEYDDFDEVDEIESLYAIRNLSKSERIGSRKKPAIPASDGVQLAELENDLSSLSISYNASRHERGWLIHSIGDFFDQRWLDDVLRLVKGGKEANVYQCLANSSVQGLDQPYLAAKIYRPRQFRNLKNDHLYREGRQHLDENGKLIKDDGKLHAIAKHTEFGREVLLTSWIEHEVKTLQVLEAAGADVPRVFASRNNAILMSFIGGTDGGAPVLHSVRLEDRQAHRVFDRVVHNIKVMLDQNRVHADLSPFNILYWEGEITIIDFPQAIDPNDNRNAYWIFVRDVVRICDYFARQGVKSDPHRLADSLWKEHHLKEIPDIHPRMLNSEDEADRTYWQHWSADDR